MRRVDNGNEIALFPITQNPLFHQNYYHHQQISAHYQTHSDDNISKVRMKMRLKINSHIKYFHFKGLRCESIYFKAEFIVSNNIHGLFRQYENAGNCSNVRTYGQLKRLSGPEAFHIICIQIYNKSEWPWRFDKNGCAAII